MGNSDETTPTPSKPKTKGNVPKADADFGSVIVEVAKAWDTNSWLMLLWTDKATFQADVASYTATLTDRNTTGGSRPQITKALENTDKEINASLQYVKGYLADSFGKADAPSYYADFGIIHHKDMYIIPADHNNRKESLKLLVAAITKYGFDTKKYGLDYWTNLSAQFTLLLDKSNTTDGTVSSQVSDKNELKKKLKKTLNSIILVIRGNYPETYKAELRTWGFQKEKY